MRRHPEIVFNGSGPREDQLAAAAQSMVNAFEALLRALMPASEPTARTEVPELLAAFDEAWVQYLDQFAAWKLEDAASLEGE